ncbi:YpjP family protein [Paraliobacillus salinarum]|uniref:YpjP family protein n=1 Tax=Paraliobacillus salinarum TaxID=1158996 RepID=UPI0015F703F6|nr:YpjP family protein [Paraliobacillus salinarum]
MQLWLKRLFVTFVSIVTLGLYVPPMQLHTDAEASNKEIEPSDENHNKQSMAVVFDQFDDASIYTSSIERDPIDQLIEQAKSQSLLKLGPKITKQIEADFTTDILPGIESVLETVLKDLPEEQINYLHITEDQVAGYGEKIFDVFNAQTGEDLIRFHVRRDIRPQEGYWFNFHYHMKQDKYESHHTIGEIYWSKDTPPKWMA